VLLADQAHAALLRLTRELEERSASRLPSERDLALRLGTSRTTVRKALDRLERDGAIHRVTGRAGGAFLSRPAARAAATVESVALEHGEPGSARRLLRSLNTVKGVPQMLQEQGFHDGTKVISAAIARPSTRAAQRLGVGPDTEVVSLLRLRFADGDTLSLERMYLSSPRCAGILGTHLDSVYEVLRSEFGISVCAADESIELAVVDGQVGSLLGQPAGTPVLRLERVGYDQDQRPVEYSVDLFRADRTRLRVRSTSGAGSAPLAASPMAG
jgi:GntR family transcriptional regulator